MTPDRAREIITRRLHPGEQIMLIEASPYNTSLSHYIRSAVIFAGSTIALFILIIYYHKNYSLMYGVLLLLIAITSAEDLFHDFNCTKIFHILTGARLLQAKLSGNKVTIENTSFDFFSTDSEHVHFFKRVIHHADVIDTQVAKFFTHHPHQFKTLISRIHSRERADITSPLHEFALGGGTETQ